MMETNLLKANRGTAGGAVKPFLMRPSAEHKAVAERATDAGNAASPLDGELAELRKQLALRDSQIAAHEDALVKAHAEGKVVGRVEAEEAFEDDRTRALEILKDGLISARSQLSQSFEKMETLALLVAMEAVDQLVANQASYRSMLTDAVTARVQEAEGDTILSIAVSRHDFPDTNEVTRLAQSLAGKSERLVVRDDLLPGECVIDLKLGALEFGIHRSWTDMKDALSSLIEDDAE